MSTKRTMPAAHVRPDERSAPTAARSQLRCGRRRGPGIVGWQAIPISPRAAGRPPLRRQMSGPPCLCSSWLSLGRGPSVCRERLRLPVSPGNAQTHVRGPSAAEQDGATRRDRHTSENSRDEHGNPQSAHSLASRSRLYGTGRRGYEPSALPPRIRGRDHGSWSRETDLSQKHVGMIVRQLEDGRLRPRHGAP